MSPIAILQEPPANGVRAVTHVHTEHSWDSRTPISKTVDCLDHLGIGLALISDHNSYQGSIECRSAARSRRLSIRIPTAAEIRTDRGDVIVIFDHDDPPPVDELTDWDSLPTRVRDAGGLIWLPHPYQSHIAVDELAEEADVIEIFNARCSENQNERAEELCSITGSVPAYGLDAHRRVELARWSVVYPEETSLLDQLRSVPYCGEPSATRRSDLAAAEVIYGLHRRSPKKVGYFSAKWAWSRLRRR